MSEYLQMRGASLNTAPFLFSRSEKSPVAVLLIHGLAASPWEVMEVGKRLFNKGFNVYGVRLAGHGTTLDDLAQQTYHDWIRSALDGFELISHFSERIVLVGESLGGLISLQLAGNQTGNGVISLAAPLYLKWTNRMFISLASHFKLFLSRYLPIEVRPYYYPKHSFHAIGEMIQFSKVIKSGLIRIRQPILVVQSENDCRVNPKSGTSIYELVQSEIKELVTFEKKLKVPHVMTTLQNPHLDLVMVNIFRFLFRISSQ